VLQIYLANKPRHAAGAGGAAAAAAAAAQEGREEGGLATHRSLLTCSCRESGGYLAGGEVSVADMANVGGVTAGVLEGGADRDESISGRAEGDVAGAPQIPSAEIPFGVTAPEGKDAGGGGLGVRTDAGKGALELSGASRGSYELNGDCPSRIIARHELFTTSSSLPLLTAPFVHPVAFCLFRCRAFPSSLPPAALCLFRCRAFPSSLPVCISYLL
jgi:hypothetical protein